MKDGGGEDISPENQKNGSRFCFPSEFLYEFDSSFAFSTPVDSVGSSSTETGSDEEDFLVGLTQQMAHSTLQEVEKSTSATSLVFASEKPMTWVLSGSLQSTLSEVRNCWSGGSGGSSRGSTSNGPSQVSPPPTTLINEIDDAWELLYAAAGQAVRMKINDEGTKRQQQQKHASRVLLGPPRKPSPVSIPLPVKTAGAAVFLIHYTIWTYIHCCFVCEMKFLNGYINISVFPTAASYATTPTHIVVVLYVTRVK